MEKEIIRATPGQTVVVHCIAYGKNNDINVIFYSTLDDVRNPITFQIGAGHVIKGWDEGVQEMRIGELARLKCPPEYAFGTKGFSEWGIMPNSHLVFELELLYAE